MTPYLDPGDLCLYIALAALAGHVPGAKEWFARRRAKFKKP